SHPVASCGRPLALHPFYNFSVSLSHAHYGDRFRLLSFFFNDTATTEIYTLSLHDALPIYRLMLMVGLSFRERVDRKSGSAGMPRSEERFSRNAETDLVCRLLLEKKKNLTSEDTRMRQETATDDIPGEAHHLWSTSHDAHTI